MKKFMWVPLFLIVVAGCCPDFGRPELFPALEQNTAAREQAFRVRWQAKIKANLKDNADKATIEQYLDTHGAGLKNIADTAKSLHDAFKEQQK